VSKAKQLPGTVDDATTAQGMLMKHFEDAWAEVHDAEGKTDAMKEILKGLDERSTALAKGVPYGNTWSLDKRKKLMFAALVGSYIAMDTEANLEKYATCGSGKMCLHFPLFFGEDNNLAYGLGEEVMSAYKGLVVTKYPGAKRDRFHLMSPCKTDLVVEAHDDTDGFCKCEEYFGTDKVCFKLQKVRCRWDVAAVGESVPINADGTCPSEYTFNGYTAEVTPEYDELENVDGGSNYFCCDADDDLEECIYDFMHEDGCEPSGTEDCLKDMYRDCYFDPDSPNYPWPDNEGTHYCDGVFPAYCQGGNCIGPKVSNDHFPVPLCKNQDTFPVSINLKENVIDVENPYSSSKTYSPVTVCTNSWSQEFFDNLGVTTIKNMPCITVKYDVESLKSYSLSGFGENYCAENDDQFVDKVQGACFWGGIAGAVAVSCMSGPFSPVTMQVTLPVAIGSGGTACEKLVNMGGKWLHSQY
jgi:hypothetical protein